MTGRPVEEKSDDDMHEPPSLARLADRDDCYWYDKKCLWETPWDRDVECVCKPNCQDFKPNTKNQFLLAIFNKPLVGSTMLSVVNESNSSDHGRDRWLPGMNENQLAVLNALSSDPLTPSEVSEFAGRSKSLTLSILGRFVELGLVSRHGRHSSARFWLAKPEEAYHRKNTLTAG